MKDNIVLPCGTVVGIGKLKVFVSNSFPHEIPTLSFTVAKDEKGCFTATCIQLVIEADGDTPNAAIKNMQGRVIYFLNTLFTKQETKDFAWEQLHELYNTTVMQQYWQAYRDFQLNLAENGVSTDTKRVYQEEISKLKQRIIDLEAMLGLESIREIETKIVEYQENAA